jgi:hypothetical protein
MRVYSVMERMTNPRADEPRLNESGASDVDSDVASLSPHLLRPSLCFLPCMTMTGRHGVSTQSAAGI